MRKPIIAIDFDDTICHRGFPTTEEALEVPGAVLSIKKLQNLFDCETIIWTCRYTENDTTNAKDFLKRVGIKYDYFNENAQSMINNYGDCRKIFADVLIDDCALLPTIDDRPEGSLDWERIFTMAVNRLLSKGFLIKKEL